MEKHYIDKRVKQMKLEGVNFKCNVRVGENKNFKEIYDSFDAVILACGSEHPRDLKIPGRELDGVHFAMDFLTKQNKICEGDSIEKLIKYLLKEKM